ncbi:hypothetical protein F5878DRAFT_603808 [Lentinula raphanica]|uniref:Amidohydrolase-related domain-containing protein n=1 Tax=Lentinula raphanica TaxID=153919 RepID=A0AA38UK58_9AGAR|nr:hypothetical protein F5878DRAFT_603808 [Lentinula raphanica]
MVIGFFISKRGSTKAHEQDKSSQRILSELRRPATAIRLIVFALILVTSFCTSTLTFNLEHLNARRLVHPSAYYDRNSDPASEWQDNIFPFREQTPWDISTDFSYPRLLEYDVQKGTWLRLDVHPVTGDIVFDILGDIYCIPASESYAFDKDGNGDKDGAMGRARPLLLGVPYDADPRFSPDGKRLAFRSDAGIGIDNIWIMNWTSCEEMDVRPSSTAMDHSLAEALSEKDIDEDLLFVQRVPETAARRKSRLRREGRLYAQPVTNETYRFVTSPRFKPSGDKIIATKWYTGRVTITAPEGWEYDLPDPAASSTQKPGNIPSSSGRRLLGRSLPRGMTVEDYAEQQIGPEQFVWAKDDVVIFVKNVVDEYTLSEKDVHKGVFGIFSRNLTSGKQETLVDASPGGASRPELSRDGRSLAFVRHVRNQEALVIQDLQSGSLHYIWYGLNYDFSSGSTLSGSYPSFAFTPNDDAIIIWAQGDIYRVPLTKNGLGERVGAEEPQPVLFTAHIELRVAETRKTELDLRGLETKDTQRVHVLKELALDDTGSRAVFQAAGVSFVQVLGKIKAIRVPVLNSNSPYYSPSFVPGDNHWVVHARWSDTNFTTFELADTVSDVAYALTEVPFGRYFSPVVSKGSGHTRKIAFVKSAGDVLTGNILATAHPGIYVGDIDLPSNDAFDVVHREIRVRNLRFVPSDIDASDLALTIRFIGTETLLVQQSSRARFVSLDVEHENTGSILTGRMSNAIAVAPTLNGAIGTVGHVAFLEHQHVYFASGVGLDSRQTELWAKPGNSTKGLMRLSVDGGHSLAWSRDGKRLSWLSGPVIHSFDVVKSRQCIEAAENDRDTFGIACTSALVDKQEVLVEHSTDIARLKMNARTRHGQNSTLVAIHNATILSMETGDENRDLIEHGVMLIKDGVISAVGREELIEIPSGSDAIDAQGGFVLPGFIDVHAHWSGYTSRYPAKSWEMQTFLAYGVTTLHNPSSNTVDTFAERSRLESGQFVGPRILTTGTVVFAGTWTGLYEEIVDEAQARAALTRIKAEGGPFAISYKNYQLPARASRQRLLTAAKDLDMLCFPEGGANFDWNLAYIIDGMTTLEHTLPFAAIYEDVSKLFVKSGTSYTPVYLVNYVGPWGEEYVWANHDVPNDPKLRQFMRHDILETLTESIARPDSSYVMFNASTYAARMVHDGLKVHIGAHGEQPMGHNYHAEMSFAKRGGLSNYEILQAATSNAASTLGISQSVGSLTAGKLADFLVYSPGVDLLRDPIEVSTQLRYVGRGGRIWNADTMVEYWPVTGRKQVMPSFNP